MSEISIHVSQLGKLYKLYQKPSEKIIDAFGMGFFLKNKRKEFWALRGIDLTIKKGERVGLIGRNGAGKSTLLKTIIGNVKPTEGLIEINGNIQALMELGTGFHPEFTGRQNIRTSLSYQGFTSKQIDEMEEDIIDFSELEEFIDQPVKTYSAGMYARLGFSTATVMKPEILIIDEVLGAGDAYFAGKCVERMRKLTKETGATVLFVSHDLESVQQLCDRVIWIDRGKVRADGKPLDVIKQYNAMVRKEEEARLRARDLKVLKKHAVMLNKKEDIFVPLLFHFVPANDRKPQKINRIYKLTLVANGQEVGIIDVGWPMDNVPEQQHYIIDTKGYMDWGPSKKDQTGMYREYANYKGKYNHAPFEFSCSKDLLEKSTMFELHVEAAVKESISVEIHNGSEYVNIGTVSPNESKSIYNFSSVLLTEKSQINLEDTEKNESKSIDIIENAKENDPLFDGEYGSKELIIKNVKLLDHNLTNAKIFECGKSMQVNIEYESRAAEVNPVFVFCIYMADGKCASQWIATNSDYGAINSRSGTFIFDIKELLLGKGSYVASVGIFKSLDSHGSEAQSYHVLDRTIHFEIKQNINDKIERGICLQPFEARVIND